MKDKLGFNGLVLTDATHMLGMTAAMRREEYVPLSIAAGCDMWLFFNDVEEDYKFMMDGYKNRNHHRQRLHDALRRILGVKASIGLHKVTKEGLSCS